MALGPNGANKNGAFSASDKVSMCNYWSNRLCCEAADRAMQVHGGLGYSRHKPFEHIYRHHRRYRITEGSEEIQMRKVGAYLFGAVTILQLHAQGAGLAVDAQILSMLPYLATIVVLVMISRNPDWIRLNMPASLGKPFRPGACARSVARLRTR